MANHVILFGNAPLSIVANGNAAINADHPSESDPSKTIVGRPAVVTGVTIRYTVPDATLAAWLAAPDAAKRTTALANVRGKASKGGRVTVRRDALDALRDRYLVAATGDKNAAARMLASDLASGWLSIPTVEDDSEDYIGTLFGLADAESDDTDTDEDDTDDSGEPPTA